MSADTTEARTAARRLTTLTAGRRPPTVPEHLAGSREAIAALKLSAREDLTAALDQARTALWLLDQLHTGELCLLGAPDQEWRCWVSAPACEAMDQAALRGWLEHSDVFELEAARIEPSGEYVVELSMAT